MLYYCRKSFLTRKLPNAELNMAAAWKCTDRTCWLFLSYLLLSKQDKPACFCECTSFPPTALVRITAEETGGGMQLTVCNLTKSQDTRMKSGMRMSRTRDLTSCRRTHQTNDAGWVLSLTHPLSSHSSMAVSASTLSSSHTASGKKSSVKDWTKRCRRTWSKALVSSCKTGKVFRYQRQPVHPQSWLHGA